MKAELGFFFVETLNREVEIVNCEIKTLNCRHDVGTVN